MRAPAAGKHVLSEKPYTPPAEVTRRSMRRRGRPDPDGSVHVAAQPADAPLHGAAAGDRRGRGDPRDLQLRPVERVGHRLDPALDGGSLHVGCYTISGSRLVAGQEPESVFGYQHLAPSGVDDGFAGLLRFPSGLVAEIACAFTSHHRSLEAIGTKGNLLLRDPWLGELGGIVLDGREVEVAQDDAYRLELENMSAAILGRAQPLLGRGDALGQARTIDALYRSAAAGVPVAP
jgi:predicted dehydrogenase